jgi:hypothetical protein
LVAVCNGIVFADMIFRPKLSHHHRNHAAYQRAHGHPIGQQGVPSAPAHASKDQEPAASSPGRHDKAQVFPSSVDNASSHHTLPVLPDRLIAMATIPFPNTRLFQEALQSADTMDESELPQYELDPPYMPPSYPTDAERDQDYTDEMIQVLRGRLMRERQKFEDLRMRTSSQERLRRERQNELVTLLGKWEALNTYMEGYRAGQREMKMALHLLHWRAYLVYKLASEVDDSR